MSFRTFNSIILSLIAFAFMISVSTADENTGTTTHANEEVTELASAGSEQTAVIQLTDPDIAAADDEEPDCE